MSPLMSSRMGNAVIISSSSRKRISAKNYNDRIYNSFKIVITSLFKKKALFADFVKVISFVLAGKSLQRSLFAAVSFNKVT